MQTADNIKALIQASNTIAIFGHEYVDGDCLWSMIWLWKVLESIGKKVSYFTPYPVAKSLQFVPHRDEIQTSFDYGNYDILLFVDFTGYDRIKPFTQNKESYFDENTLIIIDHHLGKHPATTDLVLKDPSASSNCERIYEHILSRRPDKITPEIATYLYIWLTTDSGNFMYESDSVRIMHNALWLIQAGADKKRVLQNIFYRNNREMIQFWTTVVQRAQQAWWVLWTYYEDEEIAKIDIDKEEADYGFHTLRTIAGPKIYIRIRKSWNTLRWSVRGNGEIDCAGLCNTLFNGGWHHNAAGFSVDRFQDLWSGITYIIEKIQTHIANR